MNMRINAYTVAFHAGNELICISYLYPFPDQRFEFCLAISPSARPHMRQLVRFAHLTLDRLIQTGAIITARVRSGNRSGARMARLVGFVPDPDRPEVWTLGVRNSNGWIVRGRKEEQ